MIPYTCGGHVAQAAEAARLAGGSHLVARIRIFCGNDTVHLRWARYAGGFPAAELGRDSTLAARTPVFCGYYTTSFWDGARGAQGSFLAFVRERPTNTRNARHISSRESPPAAVEAVMPGSKGALEDAHTHWASPGKMRRSTRKIPAAPSPWRNRVRKNHLLDRGNSRKKENTCKWTHSPPKATPKA